MAAKFPAAIAGDADLLVAYDLQTGALAAGINDSVTAIPVADATHFTGRTNFIVAIDSELILIGSVVGTTLNVATGGRGFAGTVAAAHLDDAVVRGVHVALHHNLTADEVKAIETALGANLANICKNPWAAGVDAGGNDLSNLGAVTLATGKHLTLAGTGEIHSATKIGVGTAAPADPVEVVGAGSAKITAKTTGTNAYSIFAIKTDAKEWQVAGAGSAGAYPNSFYIYDNTAPRLCLRIDVNGNVYLPSLPTSSAGLASGALWVDGAAGNVIKRVP